MAIQSSIKVAAAIALAGAVAAGCSRLPDRVESLENARESVSSVEREPIPTWGRRVRMQDID